MTTLKAYLSLLGVLLLSGLVLMPIFVPSGTPLAHSASGAIVSAGPVLRGVHFWAAPLAALAILAHLGGTIFVKTNRPRRTGAIILVLLTGLLWFTGVLLPWDQLAFWTNGLLRGVTSQNVLWIVYWMHTLALSLLALPFLLIYVRRTRRDPAPSV